MPRFETKTHKNAARFSIPKWVQDELGIKGDGDKVKLVIDGPTGRYAGIKTMRSGPEIYGKDIKEHGIKKNQKVVVSVSRATQSINNPPIYYLPSEVQRETYEGALVTVRVNRFERDKNARRLCLQALGTACLVCGFDFKKRYGEIGKDFIHVHHLIPLAAKRKRYAVNPQKDLCPVCPNCHEMLHRRNPPFSIIELKKRLRTNAHS